MDKFESNFKKVTIFAQLSEISKNVDGWLDDIEGITLYTISRYGPGSGRIVEIGSFKGKSTIWIAKGSKLANREKVYAIDPHTGSIENKPGHKFFKNMPPSGTTKNIFLKNLRKYNVNDWVIPLIKTSQDALKDWKGDSIRFLFIDGDHRYKYVERDFLGWEKYLIRGGIIVFHDYYVWPGPTKVVDKYLRNSTEYSLLGFIKSLAIFVKK